METSEERKRGLRFMREMGMYKWTPEYVYCVRNKIHFDTFIDYEPQAAPVLTTDTTAAEAEQKREANREKLAPSFRHYSQTRMGMYEGTVSSDKSYQLQKQLAKHFYSKPWVDEPINRITKKQLQDFVNAVPLEPQSSGHLWQWTKNVFADAEEDGHAKGVCGKVKFPKGSTAPRRKPRPTFEHLKILMEDRDLRWRAAYVVLAGTLMRPGSFRLIRVEDIYLDQRDPYIQIRECKKQRAYDVPIFDFVREPLLELIDGRTEGWLTPSPKTGGPYNSGYNYDFDNAMHKHGWIKDADTKQGWRPWPGYCLYGLKRAGGDAMLNGDVGKKVPIEIVSYLMDHADIQTTQIYCGVKDRAVFETAKDITLTLDPKRSSNGAHELAATDDPAGAGNEIRTHDFNLGKVALYR